MYILHLSGQDISSVKYGNRITPPPPRPPPLPNKKKPKNKQIRNKTKTNKQSPPPRISPLKDKCLHPN